jgi:hypothetical protein
MARREGGNIYQDAIPLARPRDTLSRSQLLCLNAQQMIPVLKLENSSSGFKFRQDGTPQAMRPGNLYQYVMLIRSTQMEKLSCFSSPSSWTAAFISKLVIFMAG